MYSLLDTVRGEYNFVPINLLLGWVACDPPVL
jgi:hypothetical protein